MTFQEAEAMLAGVPSRKVMPNTFLIDEGPDTIGVKFYRTLIVLIHRDGTYNLNSGERMSKTTSKRIMAFAPVRLKTILGDTTVTARTGGAKSTFEDGMKINQDGEALPCENSPS